MMHQPQIRCFVVEVYSPSPGRNVRRDLLPWADPYISSLIHKLQQEVQMEREQADDRRPTPPRRNLRESAEAPPPLETSPHPRWDQETETPTPRKPGQPPRRPK